MSFFVQLPIIFYCLFTGCVPNYQKIKANNKKIQKECNIEKSTWLVDSYKEWSVKYPNSNLIFPQGKSIREWPNDAMVANHTTILPDWDWRPPCKIKESSICKFLYDLDNDKNNPIVGYVKSNFFSEKDTFTRFRAFYTRKEHERYGFKILQPEFHPGEKALSGQYKGKTPVGIWQLWDRSGKILGFTDFSKSSRLIHCP